MHLLHALSQWCCATWTPRSIQWGIFGSKQTEKECAAKLQRSACRETAAVSPTRSARPRHTPISACTGDGFSSRRDLQHGCCSFLAGPSQDDFPAGNLPASPQSHCQQRRSAAHPPGSLAVMLCKLPSSSSRSNSISARVGRLSLGERPRWAGRARSCAPACTAAVRLLCKSADPGPRQFIMAVEAAGQVYFVEPLRRTRSAGGGRMHEAERQKGPITASL